MLDYYKFIHEDYRRMLSALRVLLLIGAYWFAQNALAEAPPLRVLTSIRPLQLIALAVGGDAIRVEALLDPQFSPHDYQLRPSDRAKLNNTDVVLWVGPQLEAFLQAPLSALPKNIVKVALQDDIDTDPHIWMDPIATIQIAQHMSAQFAALRPERRAYFESNTKRLAAALMQMDAEYRAQIKSASELRGFMVSHDAYGRFERRYGFSHRAALTDAADMPPSAKSLLAIERELADGRIACIWRQPQESKLYERLVAERKIRSVTIDAMATQIPAVADGILQFYQRLWAAAISCLRD